jgi:hypothetical protein
MADFTLSTAPVVRDFGRSGYNKDDEDGKPKNHGRSGYNDEDDSRQSDLVNFGRSGYNKDDEDGKPKRSAN